LLRRPFSCRLGQDWATARPLKLPAETPRILADPLSDVEPLVERRNGGYGSLSSASSVTAPLRELDVACLELEELDCPREHAIVMLLRAVGRASGRVGGLARLDRPSERLPAQRFTSDKR
jgi:hypothetical protein